MGIEFDEVVGVVGPGTAQAAPGASGDDVEATEAPPEPDPDRLRAELHTLTRREARLLAD